MTSVELLRKYAAYISSVNPNIILKEYSDSISPNSRSRFAFTENTPNGKVLYASPPSGSEFAMYCIELISSGSSAEHASERMLDHMSDLAADRYHIEAETGDVTLIAFSSYEELELKLAASA